MFCDSACASYPQAPWHSRVISSNVLSSVADVSLQRLQPICWGQSVEGYAITEILDLRKSIEGYCICKPATHLLGSKCRKVSFQACNPSAGVKVWKGITSSLQPICWGQSVERYCISRTSSISSSSNSSSGSSSGSGSRLQQSAKSWRQQSATKSSWRQQSATTILAATICHQNQQPATKEVAATICH